VAPTLALVEFRLLLWVVDRWELVVRFVRPLVVLVEAHRALLVPALGEQLAAQVLLVQVVAPQVGSVVVVRVVLVVVVRVVQVVVVQVVLVDVARVSVVRRGRNRGLVVVRILMRCCRRRLPPIPKARRQFQKELSSSNVDRRLRSSLRS
jgi:hypothetical protein